ncbi:mRNA interferase MazF [compost metagenome]
MGNKYSPTVTIAPITSSKTKKRMPTHVNLKVSEVNGIEEDSTILLEQLVTIDKRRLDFKVLELPKFLEWEIDRAMLIQLGIKQ